MGVVFYFLLGYLKHSAKTAPPIIRTVPMICSGNIVSCKKMTEKITADKGSIYPHIATV